MKDIIFVRLNPDLKVINDHISHGIGDQILEEMRSTFLKESSIGVGLSNSELLSEVSNGRDGPERILSLNTKRLSQAEKVKLLADLNLGKENTTFIKYGPIKIPVGIDIIHTDELLGVAEPIGESKDRANEERTMNKLMTILAISEQAFDELLSLIPVKMNLEKKSGVKTQVDLIWKGLNNNRREAQLRALYQLNEKIITGREINGKVITEDSVIFQKISRLQEEVFTALQGELMKNF